MKVIGYCSRWDLILRRCTKRTVLHLGCIGETDRTRREKLEALQSGLALHPHLMKVAAEVIGIDLDAESIELAKLHLGVPGLFVGDVEHLEKISLDRTFDVILFGDLIEHLSCPGMAFDGIRRFMSINSELIISTPNAFSLPANIKFSLGCWREGDEHVAAYSAFTLPTALERNGFRLTELFTCFDRPPQTLKRRILFSLGVPLFRMMPDRGGTLLAIARMARSN